MSLLYCRWGWRCKAVRTRWTCSGLIFIIQFLFFLSPLHRPPTFRRPTRFCTSARRRRWVPKLFPYATRFFCDNTTTLGPRPGRAPKYFNPFIFSFTKAVSAGRTTYVVMRIFDSSVSYSHVGYDYNTLLFYNIVQILSLFYFRD